MRSQDQALIRQLMELHSGIQELKQELSEEEQEEETDEEEAEEGEEGSYWDSESERGSSSVYSSSGEGGFSISFLNVPPPLCSGVLSKRAFSRRSSVPWNSKLLEEIKLLKSLLNFLMSSKTTKTRWSKINTFVTSHHKFTSLFIFSFQTEAGQEDEWSWGKKKWKHVNSGVM